MKKLFITFLLGWGCFSPAFAADSQWRPVERVFGRPGVEQENMAQFTFPRTDLNVLVEGIPLEPGMGLTNRFVFMPLGEAKGHFGAQTLVMGEMALLDQEVPGVLALLAQKGFRVTALYNLFLGESPSVKSVQLTGLGNASHLAKDLKQALCLTGTPLARVTLPDIHPLTTRTTPTPSTGLSKDEVNLHAAAGPPTVPAPAWKTIQALLGQGRSEGNLLEYCFPRDKNIQENGVEIPPFLGTANCFRFQKAGEKVAAAGTFALLADEVNPVVETLTRHQMTVTSINNHMLDETPRLFFLNFWGVGKPEIVAKGLKAALEKISLKKE